MACYMEQQGPMSADRRRRSSLLEVTSFRPTSRSCSPRRGETTPGPSASRSPSPNYRCLGGRRHTQALILQQGEFSTPPARLRQRSSSVAVVPRRPQLVRGVRLHDRSPTAQLLELPDQAPLPKIRSFATTPRGVVSRGESLHTSAGAGRTPSPTATSPRRSPASSPGPPSQHLVVPLGSPGVGKSSLLRNFASVDLASGGDNWCGEEPQDLTVIVDERETQLTFRDCTAPTDCETLAELAQQDDSVHAFLVIYSVVDEASFAEAERLLSCLSDCGAAYRHVVILVGNKTDLVRGRTVSTAEGRQLALTHSCKFIECSGDMNHRVDELLAGIASQLRMRSEGGGGGGRSSGGVHRRRGSLGILDKLLHRHNRSCQDLFT